MQPLWPRSRLLSIVVIASLLAVLYWGIFASDRYVSEAHVIVQRTDLAGGQSFDLLSLLGEVGSSNRADQLLLRDHLLSVDMLNTLDSRLNLRAHYADPAHDLISRMWRKDASQEWFYRYYRSRVEVEVDQTSGVLIIKAQAYDPEMAHAITVVLVEEGERFMNAMAHRLAAEQVAFLEQQVKQMNQRVIETQQDVLKFQDQKGLVSPQNTAENLVGIVNKLQGALTELQTRRSAMRGYLMSNSSDVVELDLQIAAIKKQIAHERQRLASPNGRSLNKTVEEYHRLELQAGFAEDVYKAALAALTRGHIEATRNLKKLSVLQSPTTPEYPLEPRRIYNSVVFVLIALLLVGVVQLFSAIIRDHKD